ncbi:MAG: phage holin family protein, partial [Nitrospiria bacterium]
LYALKMIMRRNEGRVKIDFHIWFLKDILKIFIRWLINTAGILFAGYLVSGVYVESLMTAVVAAGVLGIVNLLIRPIIIILTLPINILTLGLFTFVINGFIFYFIGHIVKGMAIADFWSAFIGALIISIVNALAHFLIRSSSSENRSDRF